MPGIADSLTTRPYITDWNEKKNLGMGGNKALSRACAQRIAWRTFACAYERSIPRSSSAGVAIARLSKRAALKYSIGSWRRGAGCGC